MDKVISNSRHLLQKSCSDTRSANKSDVDEFAKVIDSLTEEGCSNDSDRNAFSVEYFTPCGVINAEYILKSEYEDSQKASGLYSIDAIACRDSDSIRSDMSQQITMSNSINSISEMAKMFENIIYKAGNNIDNKWQFTYIDSSLGRLNMSVTKEGQNHISVVISSLNIHESNLRRISHQLNNRLIHRGWVSQISQVHDGFAKKHGDNK
jgi:hypothetical protein